MKPESRRADVLAQNVGDELVLYDGRSHEAHRLSPTAALVWRMADGDRTMSDLASNLRQSIAGSGGDLPQAIDVEMAEELVSLALSELDRVGLLLRGLPPAGEPLTRRKMMGVAAALVPVIASVMAPTPAMAQTLPFNFVLFSGTYDGTAAAGPNGCGYGEVNMTLVLALAPGTGSSTNGSLLIYSNLSGGECGAPVVATRITNTMISVTGSGPSGEGCLFTTNVSVTVSLGPAATATLTGSLSMTRPDCGTTPFSVTATRIPTP